MPDSHRGAHLSAVPHLLPPSATELERQLSLAFNRATALPVTLRDEWSPERCAPHMLPWLAWAFGVEEWDTNWTDEQKRAAIASSLAVKRMKGTIGAVVTSVQSLGLGARVIEWFNQTPKGTPYTFDLVVTATQDGFDESQWGRLLSIVMKTKNVRSTMEELRLEVQTPLTSYRGIAALIGVNLVIGFGKSPDAWERMLLWISATEAGPLGAFLDDSTYSLPVASENAWITFLAGRQGEWEPAMAFGGYGQATTTLARTLGTGDFTVEFWAKPWPDHSELNTPNATYVQLGSDPATGVLRIARDGYSDPHQLKVTVQSAPDGDPDSEPLTVFEPSAMTQTPYDAWTHVALVRVGGPDGTFRLFIDGSLVGDTLIGAATNLANADVGIGGDFVGRWPFGGVLDNVGIAAEARYLADFDPVADATYQPPPLTT